jgi:hypothetical protein
VARGNAGLDRRDRTPDRDAKLNPTTTLSYNADGVASKEQVAMSVPISIRLDETVHAMPEALRYDARRPNFGEGNLGTALRQGKRGVRAGSVRVGKRMPASRIRSIQPVRVPAYRATIGMRKPMLSSATWLALMRVRASRGVRPALSSAISPASGLASSCTDNEERQARECGKLLKGNLICVFATEGAAAGRRRNLHFGIHSTPAPS